MAGFRTHIAFSTTLGVGYGAAGLFVLPAHDGELPLATCGLAAGLCSVSGMLPDLDSDSGVPIRETMALAAAVVPMLLMRRFAHLGMSHESMVLAGAAVYLFVRFGLGGLLKRYTVHRGMFHSIPAAAIAGILAFLLCQCNDLTERYYKAGAVVLGFMSHLLLDELWAIDWRLGKLRLKQSFGTAMKFWGESTWANVSTYGKLLLLVALATQDPVWVQETEAQIIQGQTTPNMAVEKIKNWWR
ncbi:MAG: metal-dependent hydrolase [Planctomycetes bacterium]|nr:metal-dependent hydrolase [Planctomycetota bacterium]